MLSNLTKRIHHAKLDELNNMGDPYAQGITEHKHHILIRYTELAGLCSYQAWSEGRIVQRNMHTGQLPEWLQLLVHIGKLGDHFQLSAESPPTQVLWVETDKSQNLVRFIRHTT
jgi:hypothetical protein